MSKKNQPEDASQKASEQRADEESKQVFKKGTPQDVASTRATNSRHRKVTADKWNQ